MYDSTTLTRYGKVSAASVATPTRSSYSPRARVVAPPKVSPTKSGPKEATENNLWNEASDDGANLIKTHEKKTHVPDRLHLLESEHPRRYRHPHTQRQLSVASTSLYGAKVCLPSALKATCEESDEEVNYLKRLNAQLASNDTIEEWVRSYQLERGKFASFAVFTEVKLDEVQECFVKQAGRPNAVEAAACCATLLKMPGIVGCYTTLLEKLSAGIQSAIYLPESAPTVSTNLTLKDSMATLVNTFYSRTPYFERVRELEKTLLTTRSITDVNVLKGVTIDDVARIFQYIPFALIVAGLAKVDAMNCGMLDQLCDALQNQQGLLLQQQKNNDNGEDLNYPVHVPLATSAQICRAITHNAATISSSGRDMILCAIVDLVDVSSFHGVYKHFNTHGKMCFLHYLSLIEEMNELELVTDALPNAGETLFRLYLATCSGRVGDLFDRNDLEGELVKVLSPKDVFFSKLLSSDMEFFFLNDLAAYLTAAQWNLLSKEFEKHELARDNQKKRPTKVDTENSIIENEDTSDELQTTPLSGDSFQVIMMNYVRHHNLASAQVLQLVVDTFLSMLGKREFSQLFDSCWAQFSLDSRWAKALAVIQDLKTSSAAKDANGEHIASMRFKMLKKVFMMLTQEERAAWMDQTNAKYPSESYKKKIGCRKDSESASPNSCASVTHTSLVNVDPKMSWLDALIKYMHDNFGDFERLSALQDVLLQFALEKTPSPSKSPPHVQPPLASAKDVPDQPRTADRASVVVAPSNGFALMKKDAVDRAVSPIFDYQTSSFDKSGVETSNAINQALQKLLEHRSESQVLEILQLALDVKDINISADTDAIKHTEDELVKLPLVSGLSWQVKRKLTAVTAVAEPMEWHEYVKVGHFDVGCQTRSEQESCGSIGLLRDTMSSHATSRISASPIRRKSFTLNSLLGKYTGRTKKEGYQKINSAAVPRAISGLITSWRMNTDQLVQFAKKSLANVLKIIGDAYSEMLTAMKRKAQQQRSLYATTRGIGRPLNLAQIVYQSFLHSYGLPSIADMHLLAFSCAIESYRKQHLRVEFFAKFCFEEVPKSELTHYCAFLECIVSDDLSSTTMMANSLPATPFPVSNSTRDAAQNTPSKRSRLVPRPSVSDKEHWFISLDRAVEIAQLCFREMRKTAVTAFCENLMTIAAKGNSTAILPLAVVMGQDSQSANSDQLNVDHLLQLVVAEWQQEQVRRECHLLDAFRAGDVNGDGQLTSAEFSQIVLSIDASRDMGDILLMYSDTLRRTECEQLNADVFLQVAREHELDRVVWQGDGDLFGVVNNVADMDATWAHVRGFFVGTLEALARDLPSTHFLRVCEGAGCGCLKCQLDGYVGFQKMRRDFAVTQSQQNVTGTSNRRITTVGVSSQLIWARFWYLMRQLYDAAAESDGIVTPWEGCKYIRDEPVPTLASRSNSKRRDSLPSFLFPDTARITAKMSEVQTQEVFDAPTIYAQFAYLVKNVSLVTDSTSHS